MNAISLSGSVSVSISCVYVYSFCICIGLPHQPQRKQISKPLQTENQSQNRNQNPTKSRCLEWSGMEWNGCFCLHTVEIHLAAVATSQFFNLCREYFLICICVYMYINMRPYSECDEAPDDWKRKVNVHFPIRRTHENRILICAPYLIRYSG